MSKKPKKVKPAVKITAQPALDVPKSLTLIAALANRLLEEGHWTKAATKALSGKEELNPHPEVHE
jgi:hypothetical protein